MSSWWNHICSPSARHWIRCQTQCDTRSPHSPDGYAKGVRADIERLKAAGFEEIKLKNLWSRAASIRGSNTQWRRPETGLALRSAVPHAGQPGGQGTHA